MSTFTIVASTFRGTNTTDTNLGLHINAFTRLVQDATAKGWEVEQVVGVYHEEGMAEPSREVSIMIKNVIEKDVQDLMIVFCELYKQDCILVIDQVTKEANLKSLSWESFVGYSQSVSKEYAMDNGIYTMLADGSFMVCGSKIVKVEK